MIPRNFADETHSFGDITTVTVHCQYYVINIIYIHIYIYIYILFIIIID